MNDWPIVKESTWQKEMAKINNDDEGQEAVEKASDNKQQKDITLEHVYFKVYFKH